MLNKYKILVTIIFLFQVLAASAYAEQLVASKTSNKYHYATCQWAKKISAKNLIKFNSPEEAVKSGHVPCPVCRPPVSSLAGNDLISLGEVPTSAAPSPSTPVGGDSVNPAGNKPAAVRSPEARSILFVTGANPDYPATSMFIDAVKAKLQESSDYAINYSYEYLHLKFDYSDIERETALIQSLKQKYVGHEPDVIIAHLCPFINKNPGSIFPGVPVIYVGSETDLGSLKTTINMISYPGTYDFKNVFEVIPQVQPGIKKVYIIIGDAEEERAALSTIKQITRNYEYQIDFIYLNNQSFTDMLETVKKLESDSAVLYFHVFRDVEGKTYMPVKALRMLRKVASVPIYGISEQYMGNGSIGGYLYSRQNQGKQVAEIAAMILNGKNIADIRPENNSMAEYVFDWRELQRWKIDESQLPAGSRVEYKQNTAWNLYKWQIIGVLIIIIIQALLIAALLANTYRRKRAEKEILELNLQLEVKVTERTRELENVIKELNAAREFQDATTSEIVKLYGQQYITSRKDSLTGLYNRRHMEEKIQEEFAFFLRNGRLFSIVIGDIDFFKKVNDTYGHDAGDCILKSIADDLQESVRACDIVARWGGEEFLFLLPEIDLEGTNVLAERIRKKIEEHAYYYNGQKIPATMTMGISSIRVSDKIDDVIKRVDNALFEGKRNGRNCVVSA